MMTLSIVIPTFNTAAMTLACCRAAIAAAPASEIIVVDDASIDGTRAILNAELPDVRVVRLESNARFAGAANAGVAVARGDIVLLLNSDTRIESAAPAALLDAFARDERLGIAGARLLNLDGTPQWSGGPLPTLLWLAVMVSGSARFLPRRRRVSNGEVAWVSGAAMAFRRETWNDAGPLNESYRFYAQDLELCARARRAGWRVRIVEDARVAHEGGATMPRDPGLLWLDLLQWGRAYYGRRWAAWARWFMAAMAVLRIAARRVTGSTTGEYRRALRQLFAEREKVADQHAGGVPALDQPPSGVTDRSRP